MNNFLDHHYLPSLIFFLSKYESLATSPHDEQFPSDLNSISFLNSILLEGLTLFSALLLSMASDRIIAELTQYRNSVLTFTTSLLTSQIIRQDLRSLANKIRTRLIEKGLYDLDYVDVT